MLSAGALPPPREPAPTRRGGLLTPPADNDPARHTDAQAAVQAGVEGGIDPTGLARAPCGL